MGGSITFQERSVLDLTSTIDGRDGIHCSARNVDHLGGGREAEKTVCLCDWFTGYRYTTSVLVYVCACM